MQKIHCEIFINASRQKVWEVMLGDVTYREWTKVFMDGSYYQGDWKQDSEMLFLAPNKNGGESGMVSRIAELRPHEYVSIQHLGFIENGVKDTTSDKIKDWIGAHENYTFTEQDGGTKLIVDLDVVESEKEYMEKAWADGLAKLKELAEKE